jgi:hypothetical protein
MGKQGAVVDGVVVLPSTGGEPCIVMLKNNSEFTIHNKTFRFQYPSKEFRVTFLAVSILTFIRRRHLTVIIFN